MIKCRTRRLNEIYSRWVSYTSTIDENLVKPDITFIYCSVTFYLVTIMCQKRNLIQLLNIRVENNFTTWLFWLQFHQSHVILDGRMLFKTIECDN